MTQEEKRQFDEMKRELEELKTFKESMEFSSRVPLRVDQAFRERFKFVAKQDTGSASTQNIELSGDEETIVVPAQPSGTLIVSVGNETFELLVK